MRYQRRSGHRAIVLLAAIALLFPDVVAGQSPAPSSQPGADGPVVALAGAAIVLPRDGTIFASVESASASAASDFGIDQPFHQLLVADATHNVGATAEVGTFTAGTSLVFYIFTAQFGTTYLSTGDHAQVEQQGDASWLIRWEDFNDFDFNDLVTRISYDPPVQPSPDGTEPNENFDTGGDPVQTFTGAFQYRRLDLAIAGRGPSLSFLRAYSSADTRVGPLGPGWTHAYSIRLRSPGDATSDLLLVGPDGNTDRYVATGGTFSPPPAVYRTLVRNADMSFTATDKSRTTWKFNQAGDLTAITDRYGNTSSLTYDTAGNLISVSDPAGRGSLTFAYTAGRLTSVTDWASPARSVAYGYDASGRLQTVTDREGKTTTFGYDGTSHRLTMITDARGHVAMTLTYDGSGRVQSQKDARGLVTGDATTFGYFLNPDGTRVTTVTSPPTSFEPAFNPTIVDSYSDLGFITQRVTSPSSTETLTESYTYDATGNRTSVTDPRGNRTDFCYDVNYAGGAIAGSRGNLTRRVDPPPILGANRPVSLVAYDSANNVTQVVAPKGVPSGTTVTCATNLAAIATAYATDFAYDASTVKLLSVTGRFTDPDLGLQTATAKYEYGDAANPGAVTRIIPPRGNSGPSPDYTYATTMTYFGAGSKAGLPATLADALGNTTSYDYDTIGRLISVVDPNGNAPGGVPADHTTAFGYDNQDRTRFVRLPAPFAGGTQLVTETRYDDVGNPIVRIDANGQVSTYAYDERDGLFQVKESPAAWTDPASPPAGVITTEYAYDAAGNLTRMTRAKSDATYERATDYAYDGRGLVRTETQYPAWPSTAGPLVTAYTHDPNGNLATLLDPLGRTRTQGYDALDRLTIIDYSDPATADVAYSYDANGNRTSMVDGTGSTTYAYDEADRLTMVTSPGPKVVGFRYDLDGNRTKLIYPDASAVTYTFNKAGQLASLSDWASRSVAYAYWPDGLVRTTTSPDTSIATYTYDNAHRATDTRTDVGSTLVAHHAYELDPIGNVTGLDEFVSGITTSDWSPFARVNADDSLLQSSPSVAVRTDDTAYAAWEQDPIGFAADIHFSIRNPSTGAWGPQERVNTVTAGAQRDPDIGADGTGNVVAVWTDPGAADLNIFSSKRSASTGTWSNSARVNDDPTNKHPDQSAPAIAVRSTGEAIVVWLDKRGGKDNVYSARLSAGGSTWATNLKVTTNGTSAKSAPDVAFGSDGTAYAVWTERVNNDSDVWFATLAPGSSVWSANAKISDDSGTANQTVPQVGVDAAGNLTVSWHHSTPGFSDADVRVRRRPAGSSTWAPSVAVGVGSPQTCPPSLAVRADGRAILSWCNDVFFSWENVLASEYDPASGTWSPQEPVYDAAQENKGGASAAIGTTGALVVWQNEPGDIYASAKSLTSGGTDSSNYSYDRLHRLTGVTGPDGDRSYGYDPVGNRTSKVLGGTTEYTYDRADRITAAGALAITVDAAGNLTNRGSDTFTYDAANRLITATVAGVTETYAYDGDGVRVSRQVGANPAIAYVNDVNRGLPVTLDDGTRKYVWGLGLAYAVSGTAIEVYHADRLGSVRAITDASGVVTATFRTDEFGVPTSSTGSTTQPYGFTGEPRDGTGLSYLRTRYYDPGLGRFLTRDSWAGSTIDPVTLHRYVYVGNGPTNLTDPTGRCWPLCFAAVGAAIGGAVGGIVYTATNMNTWDAGGFAGSVAGGAVAGAVSAVAGPLGGSIGLAVTGSASGGAAMAATAGIGALGGAAGTQLSSLIGTGQPATPMETLQGALLNGAGAAIANVLFPFRNVWTASQMPFFAPHTLATLLGRGLNATAFQRSTIASSWYSVVQFLFPWNWGQSGSQVKRPD